MTLDIKRLSPLNGGITGIRQTQIPEPLVSYTLTPYRVRVPAAERPKRATVIPWNL